jgi:general stress protein 26
MTDSTTPSGGQTASEDELDTIRSIMKDARFATVTTHSNDGELYSRPLAVLNADEFDGTVYFFTQDPSPKTEDVAHDPHVNVAYADGASHVSLSGTASVTRDAGLIDKFWNPWAESWFDNGRDDPTVALLKVDATSIEYWHVDKPAVVRAVEVAKALITKQAPDVGESKTVEL